MVVDAGHSDLARDPRAFEQRLRDDQAALLVELDVRRPAEEVAAHLARRLGQRVERLDPVRHPLPRRPWIGVEAAVEATRHDDAFLEGSAELRRECEAVLVIERVVVLTQQHGPLRPTLSHYPPLVNPGRGIRATRRLPKAPAPDAA